jgi:hypothetical protein
MFNLTGWESFLMWLIYAGIPLGIVFTIGFVLGTWIY